MIKIHPTPAKTDVRVQPTTRKERQWLAAYFQDRKWVHLADAANEQLLWGGSGVELDVTTAAKVAADAINSGFKVVAW